MQMVNSGTRKQWIDYCRGIAILLVVWGHLVQPIEERYNYELVTFIRTSVYSFHMPLFFFISGVCFNPKSGISFKEYVIKQFKALLIPGYVGMIISCIYQSIFQGFPFFSYIGSFEIIKTLFWFNTGEFVYWYLGALFILEIVLFYMFNNYSEKVIIIFISVTFALMCGYQVIHAGLPFSISSAIVCLPFFFVGYKIKQLDSIIKERKAVILIFLQLICIFINIFLNCIEGNHIVSIWNGVIYNPITYIMKATTGIIVCVVAAIIFERMRITVRFNYLLCLGSNTLFIYLFHHYYIDFYIFLRNKFAGNGFLKTDFANILVTLLIGFASVVTSMGLKKIKQHLLS